MKVVWKAIEVVALLMSIWVLLLWSVGSLCAQLRKEDVDFEFIDTVTIKKGDTLFRLSAKYYGDPLRWSFIKEMNRIPDEKAIAVGTVIYIPAKDAKRIVSEGIQERRAKPDELFATESLLISDLIATQSTIGTGDTTSVETFVDYTGDETVLTYTWSADAGTIRGYGRRVVYKAPDEPGTYLINVRVTDGAISSGRTVEIRVDQQSANEALVLGRDVHWPAVANDDRLAFDVRIVRIASGKVLLHYDITQDEDDFDAFLSIQIDQQPILQEMAIGGEQPSTGVRTVRYLDVSDIITRPGQYTIAFYIEPGNRVKNGWLMNEARIVGVEGSSTPQQ